MELHLSQNPPHKKLYINRNEDPPSSFQLRQNVGTRQSRNVLYEKQTGLAPPKLGSDEQQVIL